VRLAVAAVLFLVLAALASSGATASMDRAATVWVQRTAPGPDLAAAVFVFLGDAEVVIPLAVLVGAALYRRDRARGGGILWLAAALVAASALAVVLKRLIPSPGPPPALQRPVPFRLGANLPTPFSFPSGHTTRTTLIAGTLLRRHPALAGAVLLCMMAALTYLGDHWATDVLGGLCLGWVCVEILRYLRCLRPAARGR